MGWTVLYIAFGLVALWLLGEVLLQYKARLRWRLLAFAGFVGVVLGVAMPSVVVIAVGAVAFAVGQTLVTLSFRKGFSTGWALGGGPGTSRRRRPVQPMEPVDEHPDGHRSASDGYPDQDYQREHAEQRAYGGEHGYDDQTSAEPAYGAAPQDAAGYPAQGDAGYGTPDEGPGGTPGYGYPTAPVPGYGHSYDAYDDTPGGYPAPGPQQTDFAATAQFEPVPGHEAAVGQAHAPGGYGYPGSVPSGDYSNVGYHAAPRPDGAPADYPEPTGHGFSYPGYSDPLSGSGASFGDYGQLYGDSAQGGEYGSGYPGQYPTGDAYGGYDPSAQWPGTGQPTSGGYYPDTPPGGVWMPQQREAGRPENPAPSYGYPQSPGPPGHYDGQRY